MKYTTGAALLVAALLTGTLPGPALAEEAATAAEFKVAAVTSQTLQQELEARLQKDADAVTAGALTAVSDLKLPLETERLGPATLVLVSDL